MTRHPEAHIGRRWVLGIVIGTLGFEIWTDVMHLIAVGTMGWLSILVRFALTCILLDYLYFGYAWARWLSAAILLISGPTLLISLLRAGILNDFALVALLVFIGYTVAGCALVFSKGVRDYFAMRRELREGVDIMPEIPVS